MFFFFRTCKQQQITGRLETKKVLTLQTHTSIWIKIVLKNEQNFGVEKIQIVVVISMKNVPQKWRRKK